VSENLVARLGEIIEATVRTIAEQAAEADELVE
jgi:hypothetical protein